MAWKEYSLVKRTDRLTRGMTTWYVRFRDDTGRILRRITRLDPRRLRKSVNDGLIRTGPPV
jgi:hypothetical protein